ncbi:MAG: hypothetical protein IKL73_02935 [Lachnospiraceae bacterium]|nr:hypothetical protein [Lachnospiraceae bacterium]
MRYFLRFLKVVSVIFFSLSVIVNIFIGEGNIYHIITSINNGTYGVESSGCDMSILIIIIWGLALLVTGGVSAIASTIGLIISYAYKNLEKKEGNRLFFGAMLIASVIGGIFFYVVSALYIKM